MARVMWSVVACLAVAALLVLVGWWRVDRRRWRRERDLLQNSLAQLRVEKEELAVQESIKLQTLFNGMIEGRNIELASGRRIVQAWRVKNWPAGRFSLVSFGLEPDANGTRLVFDHFGFPDDDRAHLDAGWHKMYWEPLRQYFARKA